MKRFIAELNVGTHINIPADRMELNQDGTGILVYNGKALVGFVDLSAAITAHISEMGGGKP